MAVSTFVQVNILAAVASPTQPAFNIGGVVGYHNAWTDRSRTYNSLSALNADGFAAAESSSATASAGIAKAAAAFFGQSPNPGVFKVFRSSAAQTKIFTVACSVATDNTAYSISFGTLTASFTSGAGTTGILIAAGLVSAINALSITGVTAANSGTSTVTITGTAGTWYHIDISASVGTGLNVTETTADPGYATELAAIALADSAFYGLVCVDHSKAVSVAVAGWTQANSRVFFTSSQNFDVLASGGTDTINTFKTNTYTRAAAWAHQDPGQFVEAAVMGFFFPFTPGSVNYFMKTLSGVSISPTSWLTDTGVASVLAKNGNVYRAESGLNVTYPGTMGSGQYIDITTGIDYMTARTQARIISAMVNSQKIPYTQLGAGVIEAALRAQIKEEIDIGFAADDSFLTVTVPLVSAQASIDRAARVMRNVNFTFRAAGAVQQVVINGTVTA